MNQFKSFQDSYSNIREKLDLSEVAKMVPFWYIIRETKISPCHIKWYMLAHICMAVMLWQFRTPWNYLSADEALLKGS
jgi:hypothetical protein